MRNITVEDLKKNNTRESLWICIDNKIYDVTSFTKHPGQFEILLKHGGRDVTKKFNNIHSEKAFKMKDKFYIGDLDSNPIYSLKVYTSILAPKHLYGLGKVANSVYIRFLGFLWVC